MNVPPFGFQFNSTCEAVEVPSYSFVPKKLSYSKNELLVDAFEEISPEEATEMIHPGVECHVIPTSVSQPKT